MNRKYTETDVLEMLNEASGTVPETPLETPTMNFGKAAKKNKLVSNGLEITKNIPLGDSDEEPLPLPKMNFSGQEETVESGFDDSAEQPLALPVMRF